MQRDIGRQEQSVQQSPPPTHVDWKFDRAWWDSDYLPAIMLSVWGGIMWGLIALLTSITWDLDQSWYENSPSYLLPLRIALLWPVWATVQAEGALTALGWNIGNGIFLVSILVAILPVLSLAALWTWLSNRRH